MAITQPKSKLEEIFYSPLATGIALFVAAIFAMLIANSPFSYLYEDIRNVPVKLGIGTWLIDQPLYLWVNEAIMSFFFLLVGMEIKQEFLTGHLAKKEQRILPVMAMLGGLFVPILFYVWINMGNDDTMRGWAIPAATDIAFALGVMAMFGKRVPIGLKVCLVAVAVMDDLAAIIIIALFYGGNIMLEPLYLAVALTLFGYILNMHGVVKSSVYMVLGVVIWWCILKSGIHATLAGVITGLLIPLRATNSDGESPLLSVEHSLIPWVNFGVVPLFAFVNAGVSLSGIGMPELQQPITLGIIAGLLLGKPIGILLMSVLCVMLGWATLPKNTNWPQYVGMACLTGMGFTMSYFIGGLAFDGDATHTASIRLGVLVGTVASAIIGAFILYMTTRNAQDDSEFKSTKEKENTSMV